MCPAQFTSRLSKLVVATCLSSLSFSLAHGSGITALPALSPLDQAPYTISAKSDLTIRPDRTVHKITTLRIKIQSEGAIQSLGQQRLSYIEGMETVDIIEAYTEKADGRRIEVDPAQIITSDATSGLAVMFLRDQKVRTVIFPDLSVGDVIVLKTSSDKSKDFFPNQFSNEFLFARATPVKDATITITTPKKVPIKLYVHGDEIHQTTEDGEFGTRYVINYQSRGVLAEQAGAISALDRDPYVLVTSFSNYAELGRAYWTEAAPKAEVTPLIQKIADTVTDGMADHRSQAEALDRWIKRNIRYVAVYVGAGRWTPHSADEVLKNRYGDCKDHAILLAALLAAKSIASEQVLINQGNAYTLPEVVTKSYFNHAILYIPEFDVYDDPTATYAAFGVLHEQAYDKPVVHAGPDGGRVARTPAMHASDHVSINRTLINVAADGTIRGETTQTGTGIFASGLRVDTVRILTNGPETAAANLLKYWGTPGKGRVMASSPVASDDAYQVKVSFTYDNKWVVPLAGQRIIPLGAPLLKRPGDYLLNVRQDNRHYSFQCYSGRQIEEIKVTFAEELPLPQKINGRTINNRIFTYTSNYSQEGRTFTVRREFTAHVPGQVCAPEVEGEIAEGIKTMHGSMGTRLTFRTTSLPPVTQSQPPNVHKVDVPAKTMVVQN